MSIEISLLADRPELIDQLVAGYEAWSPDWYGPGGRGDARADLMVRTRRESVPCGVVASEAGLAVGTCALAQESMSRQGEFRAWLVGLWVAPAHRRQGVAGALLDAAVRQAAALHIGEVRAGMTTAGPLFARCAWRELQPILHQGVETQIWSIRPG